MLPASRHAQVHRAGHRLLLQPCSQPPKPRAHWHLPARTGGTFARSLLHHVAPWLQAAPQQPCHLTARTAWHGATLPHNPVHSVPNGQPRVLVQSQPTAKQPLPLSRQVHRTSTRWSDAATVNGCPGNMIALRQQHCLRTTRARVRIASASATTGEPNHHKHTRRMS